MLTIDAVRGALADRFDLQREGGRGSIGTVYQALDRNTGRPVAIKVLHREVAATIDPARFTRALSFSAGIRHPGIVPCQDPLVVDGLLAFTMPWLSGESLRDRLAREGQLSMADALRFVTDIAAALDAAHAEGLVHGRLHPGAIQLDGQRALLADVGLTAVLNADPLGARNRATRSSAAYLSPEQCDGRAPGPASDVYALGCLLFEMLAGAPPYTGATVDMILAQHRAGEVPSIRAVRPTVPAAVETVLLSALAPNPRHRPLSGTAFIALLQGSVAAVPSSPSAPAPVAPAPLAAAPVAPAEGEPSSIADAPPAPRTPKPIPPDQLYDPPPPTTRGRAPRRPEPELTPESAPIISPKTGRPTTWALTIDAKEKPWYRKPILILLAIIAIVAFGLYQLDKVIDPEKPAAEAAAAEGGR